MDQTNQQLLYMSIHYFVTLVVRQWPHILLHYFQHQPSSHRAAMCVRLLHSFCPQRFPLTWEDLKLLIFIICVIDSSRTHIAYKGDRASLEVMVWDTSVRKQINTIVLTGKWTPHSTQWWLRKSTTSFSCIIVYI